MPLPPDDSLMSRFDRHRLLRFRARDGIVAVALTSLVLILCAGASVRRAGEGMSPGPGRALVLAVGRPAGWLADRLPLASASHDATAWLSPDKALGSGGSFDAVAGGPAVAARTPPVTADAFDPAQLGGKPPPPRPLKTLLVTGDSMSTPLDENLARRLAGSAVHVIRDPHLGTGISKSFLVDWGQLSTEQVKKDAPGAVVVFIGANEGFPLKVGNGSVNCCGADWAAAYATRVRAMMDTYRRGGAARVYWILLPTPRSAARAKISKVVNAAIGVAAEPWRTQVRVIDTVPTFTPSGYRDAMPVNGTDTIVRQPDGIHLNDAGADLLATIVLGRMRQDFAFE